MLEQHAGSSRCLATGHVVRHFPLNVFSRPFVPLIFRPVEILLWVPPCTLHRRGLFSCASSGVGVEFCRFGVVRKEGNHFRVSFMSQEGISWFRAWDFRKLAILLRVRLAWRMVEVSSAVLTPRVGVSRPSSISSAIPSQSWISLASWNVNGLRGTKVDEVSLVLEQAKVDICAIQEHHLNDDEFSSVSPSSFLWLASPRDGSLARKGGGVGFLVRAGLERFVSPIGTKNSPQIFWVRCNFPGLAKPLFVASAYFPDAGKPLPVFQAAIESLALDVAFFCSKGSVCVLGDLNARVGAPGVAGVGSLQRFPQVVDSVQNPQGRLLLDFCDVHELQSCLGFQDGAVPWTCYHALGRSVVDYILVGDDLSRSMADARVHNLSDLSDHTLVSVSLQLGEHFAPVAKSMAPARLVWDIAKLEEPERLLNFIEEVGNALKVLPEVCERFSNGQVDSEGVWGVFSEVFERAASSSIGKKKLPGGRRKCLSATLVAAICKRIDAFASWKCSNRSSDKELWQSAAKEVKLLRRSERLVAREALVRKVHKESNGPSKSFFSALKEFSSQGASKGASIDFLRTPEGEIVSSSSDKMQVLVGHFQKLGCPLDDPSFDSEFRDFITRQVDEWREPRNHVTVAGQDDAFAESEVEHALSKMKCGKAVDKEGFVVELFKAGGSAVIKALTLLFNTVLESKDVPATWRQGYVVSIFKAGDRCDAANYRGITVLSVVGKIFANVVRVRLAKVVSLSETQAAFRPGRSCADHVYTVSQLLQALKRAGLDTYAFFLDIQKAYDTVWRYGLYYKLYLKGVRGKLWHIIIDMLSKSAAQVRLDGALSDSFSISQGVPQGCPLSCLLFNIFIDDLADDVARKCKGLGFPLDRANPDDNDAILELLSLSFADDFLGLSGTPESLQAIIDVAYEHSRKWRYLVNVRKSAALKFIGATGLPEGEPVVFRLGDAVLPRVQQYKYLGVLFHEDTSWRHHVALVKRNGQKAVFAWMKALANRSLSFACKARILHTFVLPSFTYGAEVWDGSKAERRSLDCVLRMALRVMLGLNQSAPTELLHWETGVPLASSRLDAAKLRWDERLKAMNPIRLPALLRGFSQGGSARRGRPMAGADWGKVVHRIRDELSRVGVECAFNRPEVSTRLVENVRVNGEEGPSPPKLNNQALNRNLWSRDVKLSFIRPRCSRWSDSARPLWYPSCMSACNPGLQDHLKYLSFDDARLVSLASASCPLPRCLGRGAGVHMSALRPVSSSQHLKLRCQVSFGIHLGF